MRAKGLAFEEVYDVRGLRVIVDEVAQCYQVLSMVHSAWTPVEREFDDYIARPKPNGYQSLHTVVRDDAGRTLEVQIRTRRMHEHAELGVAAHWRYKEGGRGREDDEQRVAWLRQLLAWRAEVDAPPASGPGRDERIYVLTPQARVIELPAGGTPIDFAYHIHSELGHRCRGARVNGAIVPLNTPLASGQTVEIVAAKSGGPSRDWLNPELGYLHTARQVRQWFNASSSSSR
jgi:GTP pyrophosphokinase